MGTATLTIHPRFGGWPGKFSGLLARLQRSVNARPKALRVEQTAAVGSKGAVSVVSVNGERVLVAVTSGCIQVHPLKRTVALELPIGGTVR